MRWIDGKQLMLSRVQWLQFRKLLKSDGNFAYNHFKHKC